MVALLLSFFRQRRTTAIVTRLAAASLFLSGAAFAQVNIQITDPPGAPGRIFVGTPVSFEAVERRNNACSGTIGEQWWIEDDNGNVVTNQAGLADESPCEAPRSFSYTFSTPGDYTIHYGYTNDLGIWEALLCAFGACPAPDAEGSVSLEVRAAAGGGAGSFQIDVPASASTCGGVGGISPLAATITVLNNGGAVMQNFSGTVSLTNSSGHGTWNNGDGQGTLTDTSPDDGAAFYAFDPNDNGTVVLYLENQHSDDLVIQVSDGSATSTSAPIAFRDNALVISDNDSLTPASVPVAGRDHRLKATVWRRDGPNGDCREASAYSGVGIELKAWYSSSGNHPAGAAAPEIEGTALPNSPPANNNISLLFNDGSAGFDLTTSDVGQYHLNLIDDSSGFAVDSNGNPRPIPGGTATQLTVRPFALGFTDIQQVAAPQRSNPQAEAADGATGSGFVAAGEHFEASLGAYLWQASDDGDGDGLPDSGTDVTDNGLTPSYAWNTTLASAAPFTPAGGMLGSLGGSISPALRDFLGGAVALDNLRYSEAGSVTLSAIAEDFLGTGGADVTGTSAPVGRFYPHRFRLTGAGFENACDVFSYMDQSAMSIRYELEALNAGGTRTRNYDTSLGYAVGTVEHVAENANDGVNLSARMADPDSGNMWVRGRFTADMGDASFARGAGGPDGPYRDLALGVTVANGDGTRLAGVDMDPSTATDCVADDSCTAETLAVFEARFGRAHLDNAFGSEYRDLAVPLRAAYYGGTNLGFIPNTEDTCSMPTRIVLSDADAGDSLDVAAGDTCVQDSGQPGASESGCPDVAPSARQYTEPPLGGDFNLWLRAPGAGRHGTAFVDADVPAWLEYDWNGDGNYDNPPPTARATFGSYRGDDRIVYWREVLE